MIDKTNNQEVIAELKRISELNERLSSLTAEIVETNSGFKTEYASKKTEFSDQSVEILDSFETKQREKITIVKPTVPEICNLVPPTLPTISLSGNEMAKNNPKNILITVLSGLGMIVATPLFAIFIIFGIEAFLPIFLSLVVSVTSFFLWFGIGKSYLQFITKWHEESIEYKQKLIEWKVEFAKCDIEIENNRFLKEFREYDKNFLEYVKTCDEYYSEEIKKYREKLHAWLGDEKAKNNNWQERYDAVNKELAEVTLLHEDHIHLARNILANLQSGRADNFKEALNIALEDERKDNEAAARRQTTLEMPGNY